jgi:uncharacterized protein YciI
MRCIVLSGVIIIFLTIREADMQFIVTGLDGTDGGALDRRMAAREAHLKGAAKMAEDGRWLYAAAILNDAGQMAGSVIICEFKSEQALKKEWLDHEPYVTQDVWKTIEIKRGQVPPLFAK